MKKTMQHVAPTTAAERMAAARQRQAASGQRSVSLILHKKTVASLDAKAAQKGVTRSEVIADLLEAPQLSQKHRAALARVLRGQDRTHLWLIETDGITREDMERAIAAQIKIIKPPSGE